MKKIEELLSTIATKSFPNLSDVFASETNHIISEVQKNILYIFENDFFYFQNGVIVFQSRCITWKRWFWCEKWSFKTPLGLHYISDLIWENCSPYQRFFRRIPHSIEQPVSFWEHKPGVYGRILRLDGMENNNKTTLSRWAYIHGNIHDWYWKTDDLKRSKWCIWLKLDEMISLFDTLKDFRSRILVYIESEKNLTI